MRFLMIAVLFAACAEPVVSNSNVKCQDQSREFWVSVPYYWDELDDIQTTKMTNGCNLVTTTHYVYSNDNTDTQTNGGNLPFGYYQQQCAFDACNPPPALFNEIYE